MNNLPDPIPTAAWPAAARLVARWLDQRERIDALLETLPRTLTGTARARCQHLVLGVVRHFGRIDAALARLVAHPPRFSTRAVLFVAGYELIEAGSDPDSAGRSAKIVHHAVEQTKALASPAEARLVNAVGRKLAAMLAAESIPGPTASAADLAGYFSHPEWLIRMWLAQFGPGPTRTLLEWNQQPAPVHARWRLPNRSRPDFLQPTRWPDFFLVTPGHWPEVEAHLKAGELYLQDPSTRIPVELLAPVAGDRVLDLCAAPGGKSLLIADRMRLNSPPTAEPVPTIPASAGKEDPAALQTPPTPDEAGVASPAAGGQLVAVDLPGARIDRLKQNLSRIEGLSTALVQADLLGDIGAILREHQLPAAYDAVLIDAPCSNTGVMRHRVDVKWRLQPGDFKKHPAQQLSLLHAAARLVAPGGRLVYATCSVDAGENEHVVQAFFASRAGSGFQREAERISLPWETGHDGGAAFLLRRR